MDDGLHVTLANDLNEIVRLAALTNAFLDEHGAAADVMFKVDVALDEALSNVINYGLAGQPAATIAVDMHVVDGVLNITLTDPGPAFDPFQDAATPDLDASLDDRPIGGLGVFLVQEFMDSCSYQRIDNHNRLFLRKNIHAQEE